MFTSYEDLLIWVGQPTATLPEGLTEAISWRVTFEKQAEERDSAGNRWPVARELNRRFNIWFATTWQEWARAEGLDRDRLGASLKQLGKEMTAEIEWLDAVHVLATSKSLLFDSFLYLYYADTATYTYDPQVGDFVPWTLARFKARFKAKGYHVEEVAREGETPDRAARRFEASEQQPGFIANVIAAFHTDPPKQVDINDKRADDIVKLYESAFANPDDARDRLKVIVGINTYDSVLAPSKLTELVAEVKRAGLVVTNECRVNAVVLGYVWRQGWYDTLLDEWPSTDVMRHQFALVSQEVGAREAVVAYFPFSEMRNVLKNHAVAEIFAGQLTAANLRPFMHFGDGDAVNLAKPVPIVDLAPSLKPLKSVGLLDRFCEVWSQVPEKDRPLVSRISGGYALRGTDHGGDLDPAGVDTRSTVLANELDMMVRQILGPAAYFAEPNTFVDFATLRVVDLSQHRLTPPEPDMGPLLGRQVRQLSLGSHFDSRLSLVTSGRNAKVRCRAKDLTGVKDLIGQKNSAAGYEAWAFRVEEFYGLQPGTAAVIVMERLSNDRPLFGQMWGTNWQQVKKRRHLVNGVAPKVQEEVADLARQTAAAIRAMYYLLKG